jgi:uncharacterized protein (TIGR02246 family)
MQDDEQSIRNLFAEWQSATEAGDAARLHDLMSDDVVVFTAGQAPICGKETFLNAFREGLRHFRVSPHGDIRELCIVSDVAYCWTQLSLTITPHQEGLPMRRCGNTLSVLHKQPNGRWVIVRDAHMLTAQPVGPL